MTDAKQAENKESVLASVSLGDDPATKAATKFRYEAHDKPAPATNKNEPVNWRSELQSATTEIKKLETLKSDDPASAKERKELIESIDKRFQKALPMVRQDATSADSELLKSVAKATATDDEFKNFKVNGKPMKIESANMDAIHNAILNAPDEATRKQLTRFGALAEEHKMAMTQVDESYWKAKAPMMATLDYAQFLTKYKDGVTKDSTGHAFSAGEVLQASMSPELATSPQGRNLMQLSQDSMASHQNLLIPSEKNPITALREAETQTTDAVVGMAKLKQAVELAKDPYFEPDNINKEIAKAKLDNGPEGPAKLVALEQFSHARAITEAYLGQAQLATGNRAEAVTHLLNAGKDPEGVARFTDAKGTPIYTQTLYAALSGGDQNPVTSMQAYQKSEAETKDHYLKYGQLGQSGDYDGAAKELKLANASADEAVRNAKAIQGAIGDENGKKIKEDYNALIQKAEKGPLSDNDRAMLQTLNPLVQMQATETDALFTKAKIDIESKNHNAAVSELQELQKTNPEILGNAAFKKDFDAEMKKAKDGADYDNSNWFEKRWTDTGNLAGHAWEFAKEHEKLAAAGVALVGAAAITIGTAGFGAPIGAAIAAGVIGGAAIGTGVGAEAEVESGRATTYGSAALDVLPSALAGAATGALLAGAAPVGEGALAAEGETGAEASTSWISRGLSKINFNTNFERLPLPGVQGVSDLLGGGRLGAFAANTLRASEIAAPFSLTNSYENYKSGQDKTIGAAAADFVSTDLQFGLAGGFTKTPWLAGKFVSPFLKTLGVATNTTFQGYMMTGSYFGSESLATRFDKNSVTLPAAGDQSQNQDLPDQ